MNRISVSRMDEEDMEMSYEEQMIYDQALATIRIIEDNVQLRKLNSQLMKKIERHEKSIDEQLQNNIKFAGNLLGAMLKKAEEEQ